VPPPIARRDAGRWIKVRASDFSGLTPAAMASQLFAITVPLEPKVRQATLDGRKVVVVSWRDGSKLGAAKRAAEVAATA
jgi:hypothetical protein